VLAVGGRDPVAADADVDLGRATWLDEDGDVRRPGNARFE
jgi:hypothetical protein